MRCPHRRPLPPIRPLPADCQVNSDGTGIRSMTGLNSSGDTTEDPDIINDCSPFGAFVMPTSPTGGRASLTPRSGRPSAVARAPTQRTVVLGAPASALLNQTLSEAYDRGPGSAPAPAPVARPKGAR